MRSVFVGMVLLAVSAQVHAAGTVKSLDTAPLAFQPNRGQWHSSASFGVHAPGYSAFFQAADVTYRLQSGDRQAEVKIHWSGSLAKRDIVAVDQLPGVSNYYVGNDSSRWISGLPTYRRLRINQLYPGIDLIYYGTGRQMEYDLEVAPGADASRIKLAVEGGKPRIDEEGNLILETSAGTFIQHRPVAHQEIHGIRTSVSSRYVVNRDGTVKLALGRYDRRHKLVIDPTIAWGATLGSGTNGGGSAAAVALDSSGNVFVAGFTAATDFPLINAYDNTLGTTCCGYPDAFVTKFNPDGSTVLFSTYFGGSSTDIATAMVIDSSGNVIIAGNTSSADLSTKLAYQAAYRGGQDGFVAKFGPTGTFLYGTYLGGINADSINAVAVDSLGNIFVAGETSSSDFPKTNPYQTTLKGASDGFLTKIAADGASLLFSTYLGGANSDAVKAISLGSDGSIYVAGSTASADFPTLSAFQSTHPGSGNRAAFVTRFAASGGSLVYSTLVSGTSTNSVVFGMDVDALGSAYITGSTSNGFPIKNAAQGSFGGNIDGFLTKLSPDGTAQVYSTYWGGSGSENANAVRVDASGAATIVGYTSSNDFPTVAALKATGYNTGFVAKFNPAGAVLFSSFLGGSSTDSASSVALDSSGSTFIAGNTSSYDFPSAGNRYYGTPFVVKLTGAIISIPVTFATVPAGLKVTVDGLTVTTPKTFQWAPSVTHAIDVLSPQVTPGPNVSSFLSWSNGGSRSQIVTTPTAATTFTANLDNQTCVYAFAQSSITFGQAGSSSYLTLNTQAGCPWTLTSNVSWISPSTYLNSGPNQTYYSVSPNTGTGSRTGTITAGGATFTITQAFTKPTVSYGNYCCNGNSGLSQTFQFVTKDDDGVSDLTITNMLINNALDGRSACYLAFDHQTNILYLVNDAGTTIAGMPFDSQGRGSGVLSNSQCSVDGTKTSVQSYGTQATLNIGLTFMASFGGNKIIYFAARDKEGLNSGWLTSGVWNVPAAATFPSVVAGSVGGNYNSFTNISVTYRDAISNTNLSPSQILINDALDGRNACYMGYDHVNNRLFLLDDAGTTLLPAITPGVGTGTQQNSQCIIYAQGSYVSPNLKDYTLNVQIFFQPAFRGNRLIYAATQTTTGGNSGWQAVNAFTVQ